MSSTARLRRLSQELERLRKERELTLDDVAKALDWSRGRVGNWENGKWTRPDIGNVTRLLDFYEVPPDEQEALLSLARRTKEKDWWRAPAYRDLYGSSPPLPGFEAASSLIRQYASELVPGLFQTEDYARAVFVGGQVLDAATIKRMVDLRRARQGVLERENPPQMWAIIDEAALLRLVGGPVVMAVQIRRLIELAAWPHITIQVLPLSAGAHAGLTGGRFMIIDFAGDDDKPLVYLEEASSSLFLESAEDVRGYTLIFSRITSSALGPEESLAYLATLRDRLK